jgi:hypothetical protein
MARLVELQVRGSQAVELQLPAAPVTLGSGPSSDLRVPESSGLLERHLLLTPSDAGVTVAVGNHATGALIYHGQELREALVPWGDEAYVANLRLGFVSRGAEAGRSSTLLLLTPVLLLLIGMAAFADGEPEIDPTASVEAPSLAGPPASCREPDPARAGPRAKEAERAAHAKMQRSAFVTREGLEALDLLAESSACFRTAGLEPEAARVEAEHRAWSERLNDDYAAARLRLRLALAEERPEGALGAVRELEALLAARPSSPYTEWLTELRRKLERKKRGS